MSKFFLSYRRDDSADVTGRIYDRLVAKFSAANIFKDVDSIPLGVDFRVHLQSAVGKCQMLLAIIGRDWLNASSEGTRRLDDPRDFVRIEIEAALQRGIPVIPVLVRGGTLPREDELPASLHDLIYRNGMAVRSDPDFHRDMDRLIQHLEQASTPVAPPPPVAPQPLPPPKPVEIKIPSMGEQIAEVEITQWLVKEGEAVRLDQPVLVIESDKASQEIAAPASGRLLISRPKGARVEIGAIVGVIELPPNAKPMPISQPRHTQSASKSRTTFEFEAMDSGGKDVRGRVVADDEAQAQQKIRNRGYFVTKLKKAN